MLSDTFFDTYSESQLLTLIDRLNAQVLKLREIKRLDELKTQVLEKNYVWTIDHIELKDDDILSTLFKAYIFVFKFGKGKEDFFIKGLPTNQPDWVKHLDFKYIHHDNFQSPQEWDRISMAHTDITVQVLYKKHPPAKNGQSFSYFDTTGNIKHMEVKNDKLYTEGVYFGDVNKWDSYNLIFIFIFI